MRALREPWWKRLASLTEISAPDPERARRRIALMETTIMLPAKLLIIALTFHSFTRSPWTGAPSQADVVVETVEVIFWSYIVISAVLAVLLLQTRKLPLAVCQWSAVTNSLVDAVFLGAMTVVTGGPDSILFWLFIGLILRNAVNVPSGISQLILNSITSGCFAIAVILSVTLMGTNGMTDSPENDEWGQRLILQMSVLGLMTLCCFALEILLERQRRAIEEAAAVTAAENQLHSAGRIAAEFAHQVKNPLAIINNAAHSLQRNLRENKVPSPSHVEIIQEEVARADAIITRIMGYAQLQEQSVEKLDVVKTFEAAIAQIFPPSLPTGIKIKKNYLGNIPALLMQRGHLLDIMLNLLKNAREALGEKGTITVSADHSPDHKVQISVADDGPGIPEEQRARIFEAFYTTKKTGTGLGLSVVKHNAELYGGSVRVESKLGNGATFTVSFPLKSSVTSAIIP